MACFILVSLAEGLVGLESSANGGCWMLEGEANAEVVDLVAVGVVVSGGEDQKSPVRDMSSMGAVPEWRDGHVVGSTTRFG